MDERRRTEGLYTCVRGCEIGADVECSQWASKMDMYVASPSRCGASLEKHGSTRGEGTKEGREKGKHMNVIDSLGVKGTRGTGPSDEACMSSYASMNG